ncbi:TniQ family protein [Chromobacterium piscinae]|uniref:TniQ family protein n=1 Tax=Chromobacterium TaxID=535 RepID=UPI001E40CEE1|nr:TniQ family protein [Chromobacterium piscinae]MCD5327536.1 TniQ family protein [Chromobacterium piscinae]
MTPLALPIRPIPYLDESPASLLIRAAENNGFVSVLQLLSAYRFPSQSDEWLVASFVDQTRFAKIIHAMGLHKDCISLAYRRMGPTSKSPREMNGIGLAERLFRNGANVYCPECLKEHPYWRKAWFILPFATCNKHCIRLLQDCPSCKQPLSLTRNRLLYCPCGYDLRQGNTKMADPTGTQWLLSLITAQDQDALDRMLWFWSALREVDGLENGTAAEARRLNTTMKWYRGDQCIDEVLAVIESRAPYIHPRLQLLPFLREKGDLCDFAKRILKRHSAFIFATPPRKHEGQLSQEEAAAALGITSWQVRKMIKAGQIKFITAHLGRAKLISPNEIERVLRQLSETQQNERSHQRLSGRHSLTGIIKNILAGYARTDGYDLAEGLMTLQFSGMVEMVSSDPDWLTIPEVATKLGIHPVVAWSMIKHGTFPAKQKIIGRSKKNVVHIRDIEVFDANFVTAGRLARSIGASQLTFAHKLMHVGVKPIAGPTIDGMMVYLFKRTDLQCVDLSALKSLNKFKAPSGRRHKGAKDGGPSGILLSEVTKLLGLENIQQTLMLIRKGILEKESSVGRNVRITKASLEGLIQSLADPDLVPISQVVNIIGTSEVVVYLQWVHTGVLKILNFVHWRFVRKDDLERVLELQRNYYTASQAGKLLNVHRSHVPNLERKGLIKALVLQGSRRLRLYPRKDVEALTVTQ